MVVASLLHLLPDLCYILPHFPLSYLLNILYLIFHQPIQKLESFPPKKNKEMGEGVSLLWWAGRGVNCKLMILCHCDFTQRFETR